MMTLTAAQIKMLQAACGEITHRDWTGMGSWGEQQDLFRAGLVSCPSAFTHVRITEAGRAVLASLPSPLTRESIAAEHMALCHSDGTECEDGCDKAPVRRVR